MTSRQGRDRDEDLDDEFESWVRAVIHDNMHKIPGYILEESDLEFDDDGQLSKLVFVPDMVAKDKSNLVCVILRFWHYVKEGFSK